MSDDRAVRLAVDLNTALEDNQRLREENSRLTQERDEARDTVRSLACMLGWDNVPPRETLEHSVKAERVRLEQAEARVTLLEGLLRDVCIGHADKVTEADREAARSTIAAWWAEPDEITTQKMMLVEHIAQALASARAAGATGHATTADAALTPGGGK